MSSFFSSKKTTDESNGPESGLSMIAPGMSIKGDIVSDGDIRIEGKIIGNLTCKSRVVIGSQGVVEGTIDTLHATIAGKIIGTLVVRDTLQLQETANINGDIVTEKMVVQAGALFTGNCKMGQEAKTIMKDKSVTEIQKVVKEASK